MDVSLSSGVGDAHRVVPDLPEKSNFGQITSSQKHLLKELREDNPDLEAIKSEYLGKEAERLSILVNRGVLTEEEKQERLVKAEEFIDKHISRVETEPVQEAPAEEDSSTSPFNLMAQADAAVKSKASRRRRGLQRAEIASSRLASPDMIDYGKLTSEQWTLIRELKAGNISAEELRQKYLENEEQKLSLLMITEEEKARRLERFTSVIDKIIANVSTS